MTWEFTRRRLLAGVGAVGGSLGATRLLTGPTRAYTSYTYAGSRTDEDATRANHELRVAWWATHNDTLVSAQGDGATDASSALDPETSPAYVSDADGPVLQTSNVLPGDEGRLAIGLEASLPEEDAIAVWYRLRLLAHDENGVNEPERNAGDTTPNEAELLDWTTVTVWEDTGTVGACDGRLTSPVESPVDGGSGTLGDVLSALSAGRRFDTCLEDGDRRCLALHWQLPADDPDVNVVQGDSVAFSVEFRTTPCEDEPTNPFDEGERDA